MSYQVEVEENYVLPLPDELCHELGVNVGDILICKSASNSVEIEMTKYPDQTLSDDQIVAAGNLTRVISLM